LDHESILHYYRETIKLRSNKLLNISDRQNTKDGDTGVFKGDKALGSVDAVDAVVVQ